MFLSFVQDTWLLHSVLMLVQSWIKPLLYLQTTLGLYDYAPDMLLNKTKWVSDKLISLEQGVVVLMKKVGRKASTQGTTSGDDQHYRAGSYRYTSSS